MPSAVSVCHAQTVDVDGLTERPRRRTRTEELVCVCVFVCTGYLYVPMWILKRPERVGL